ncbi:MAG: ATP-binding protein [Sideroxydans sp.]|jgi:two-component system sensor histidine kinase PilS (NtrC family)
MREIQVPDASLFTAQRPSVVLTPEKMWRSLGFFNLYRLLLGGLLLVMSAIFGAVLSMTAREQTVFFWTSAAYTMLVLASVLAVAWRRPAPGWQLAFQVCADVVCISLLTYLSSGVQSNLPMLLLVSLVFAGLISHGRITLLYAALASIALLLEHAYAVLTQDAPEAQFFQVGILCISYFAVAWLSHTLSRYARASEKLAALRGADLASMAEANQLMIQDMPDGMLVVDERGQVRQSNPGASRLLGFSFTPDEQVGLGDCSPLLEALYAAWRQNPELGGEIQYLPRTDNPVRVRFLRIGSVGFWGAVVVLEDVHRVQEQAQQVKLAALGRLTANIAHEVRNPLSAISYATELMREGVRDPAQVRLLQLIADNTSRLDRIVQDVMQLNRRDRSQAEFLNLTLLLPGFIEALCLTEQVAPAVFKLQLPKVCTACFDRGHFEQILWNLCRNALRYSQRDSGSVRLNVASAHDGIVTLEVEDDGPGVASVVVQNLFEPFFTTDSRGTGLGLYIVRELCEANGARIEYRRGKGGGACFRITFAAPANKQGDLV